MRNHKRELKTIKEKWKNLTNSKLFYISRFSNFIFKCLNDAQDRSSNLSHNHLIHCISVADHHTQK